MWQLWCYSVLRRVPRLVNKRGRVKVPQHEEETSENLLLHKVKEGGNDVQRKEQTPDGVETLTEKMKELKLFPKLEYRRRHLKQVFKTWLLLMYHNSKIDPSFVFHDSLTSNCLGPSDEEVAYVLWTLGQVCRCLYVGTV